MRGESHFGFDVGKHFARDFGTDDQRSVPSSRFDETVAQRSHGCRNCLKIEARMCYRLRQLRSNWPAICNSDWQAQNTFTERVEV